MMLEPTSQSTSPPPLPPIMKMFEACIDDVKVAPLRFLSVGLASFFTSLFMEFGLAGSLVALFMTSKEEGSALYLLAAGMVLVVMVLTSTFVQLPIEVGVIRHLWRVQQHGEPFDSRMPVKLGFKNILMPLLVWLLVAALVVGGLVMMILPGLLVLMSLSFALPACIIGEKNPIEAIVFSLRHTLEHPQWHARLALAILFVLIGASTLPFVGQLVGPPFATLLLLRGYAAALEVDAAKPSDATS